MRSLIAFLVLAASWCACRSGVNHHHRHHRRHHRHQHGHHDQQGDLGETTVRNVSLSNATSTATSTVNQTVNHSSRFSGSNGSVTNSAASQRATQVVGQTRAKAAPQSAPNGTVAAQAGRSVRQGHLDILGPLPMDFANRFAVGVAEATGCQPAEVRLLGAVPLKSRRSQLEAEMKGKAAGTEEEITFEADSVVIQAVEEQAANPASKLFNGRLHSFIVAPEAEDEAEEATDEDEEETDTAHSPPTSVGGSRREGQARPAGEDIDLAMPYGDLEPFGREDTAQELTQASIHESDAMVDQMERAEVSEEKRSIFRALTRLRGVAITSFDGIARSQTGNVDEFAGKYQWREEHPVHHLAQDESDVSRWAFPEEVEHDKDSD